MEHVRKKGGSAGGSPARELSPHSFDEHRVAVAEEAVALLDGGPVKPPLLVEAKDDRIVIDLMKHPKFASDSRLKLALGLVVPLVTIGAIETDPEHLDVAFRPLPKGVSEVLKGVRRAVGR